MSETQNISMATTLNLSNAVSMVSDEERLEYIQQLQNRTTIIMLPAMILLILIAFVGAIGNSLVLFVYYRQFQQNPTRILIMVIAMLDLLANVLAIPGEIYDMFHIWDFDNPALCQARLFVNAFVTLSTAMALIVVAVVRYRKVCNPHGWQVTTAQAKLISVAVVFLGALISAPYVITNGRETKQTPKPGIIAYECSEDDSYKDTIWPLVNNTFFLILFIAAFLTLLILYLRIGLTTWQHSKLFRKCILEVATDSKNSHAERRSSVSTDREMNVQNMPEDLQQEASEAGHTKHLQRNGQVPIKSSMQMKVNCEFSDTFNAETEAEVGYDSLRHIPTQNEAVVKHCVSGTRVDVNNEVCEAEINNDLAGSTPIPKETTLKSHGANEFADAFKEVFKVKIQGDFYQFQNDEGKGPRVTENYVDTFEILSETPNTNNFSCNTESQKYSTFDTDENVGGLKADFETEVENVSLCKIQGQVTSMLTEKLADSVRKISEINVGVPGDVLPQDQTNLTSRLDSEFIHRVNEVAETELKNDSLHRSQTPMIMTQTIGLSCECSNNTNNVIVSQIKDVLPIKPEGALKYKQQNRETSSCEIEENRKYIGNRTKTRKIKTTTQTGHYHARTERVNRTTIIVTIISAVYCICFLPFISLSFFALLDHDSYIGLNVVEASFFNFFYRFYFINSAANPIVYSLFGRNFRQACGKLMRCRSR